MTVKTKYPECRSCRYYNAKIQRPQCKHCTAGEFYEERVSTRQPSDEELMKIYQSGRYDE